jgi:hypothetical protein
LQVILQENGFSDWNWENCPRFLAFHAGRSFTPSAAFYDPISPPLFVHGQVSLGKGMLNISLNQKISIEENARWFCHERWESVLVPMIRDDLHDWNWNTCPTYLAFEIGRSFTVHERETSIMDTPDTESHVGSAGSEAKAGTRGTLRLGQAEIPYLNGIHGLTTAQTAEQYCQEHWEIDLKQILQENGFYDWTKDNCAAFLTHEVFRNFKPVVTAIPVPVRGDIRLHDVLIHYTIDPNEAPLMTAQKYCSKHWDTGLHEVLLANNFHDWTLENCPIFLAFEASRNFVLSSVTAGDQEKK